MQLNKQWEDVVLNNFNKASNEYNKNANIQKFFALRLAKECSKRAIPGGVWADLGTGTGLLADELEKHNPNQKIIRIDRSSGMLSQQQKSSQTLLWDLNRGCPPWSKPPTLLASSFALHWLYKPNQRLQEWITNLEHSGWLALAVPVEKSFPEWQLAAKKANVTFTGLILPSEQSIIDSLGSMKIHYQEIFEYTQKAKKVFSLLKPIIKIGAQASHETKLKTGELRRLIQAWPTSQNGTEVNLTWMVQMLIAQI